MDSEMPDEDSSNSKKSGQDEDASNSSNSSFARGEKNKFSRGDTSRKENPITNPPDQIITTDSSISVEKSETTSSEDPTPSVSGTTQPRDIEVLPSTSSSSSANDYVKNLRKARNYRLHNNWILDLDSSSESDKDFLVSSDNNGEQSRREEDESRPIVVDMEAPTSAPVDNFPLLFSRDNESEGDDSDNDNEDSSDSNSGSMSDDWSDGDSSTHNEDTNSDCETPAVLLKRKPNHEWNIIKELQDRERGTTIKLGRTGKSEVAFEQRFYGSLHAVSRLELMYKMNKHKGCVNAINFHPEGKLLVSGSDDLNVIIWDWTTNTAKQLIKTGHKKNVFQSRFMYLNAASQLNIVTCARDGQVRLLQVPPSGGVALKRRLAQHLRPAHKIYTSPAEPHIVLSAGEDSQVLLSDVRQEGANKLMKVKYHSVPVALHSVCGHPLDTQELCVAGRNKLVRIYDRRKAGANAQAVKTFCPERFHNFYDSHAMQKKLKMSDIFVTCAVYNHDGTEILASYSDDDIYLFDTVTDNNAAPGSSGFTHCYSGHRNRASFKGVSFFGPHSQFVVSGSDCGNIYIWDKKSEAIVQWMMGDESGIVNGIECHPQCPILATCGLDYDIKIWVPSNESDPKLDGLQEVVKENNKAMQRPLFGPELYAPWGSNILRATFSMNGHDDDDNDEIGSRFPEFDETTCRAS